MIARASTPDTAPLLRREEQMREWAVLTLKEADRACKEWRKRALTAERKLKQALKALEQISDGYTNLGRMEMIRVAQKAIGSLPK